jgi:flavin reductase
VHDDFGPTLAAGEFRRAVGTLATAVTVVSTDGPAGRGGQTVSAMSLASYEPAMVLVCVNRRSPLGELVRRNGVFCVNALATRHDQVADSFAGRPWPGHGAWDFSCGDWDVGSPGSPRLVDALAAFECVLDRIVPAGSHHVYLGTATATHHGTGPPLVYADHAYRRLAAHRDPACATPLRTRSTPA